MGNPEAILILGDSRAMPELRDCSVDLAVTSPPYWHLKDYGCPGQIGYGQSLHAYLKDLYRVWAECFRVLREGARLCINIGDQFARAVLYGRYKVIPLHAEVIAQCEQVGLDFMGSIIWRKKTTMNTTGGANVMGSYPYPPNGLVEIDYEHILVFKKPGKTKTVPRETKEASKLTKEEWKEYFLGHWHFGGARQGSPRGTASSLGHHEAVFPEELPRRLIKMFSFVGDTVLDPFLGSGTTMKAALELGRRAIGYEVNKKFLGIIKEKLGGGSLFYTLKIVERERALPAQDITYRPSVKDIKPRASSAKTSVEKETLYKVVSILEPNSIRLHDGRAVQLLGLKVLRKEPALRYLSSRVRGKEVFLRVPDTAKNPPLKAYVYLKNRLFVNAYMIKSGLAVPDADCIHPLKGKFQKLYSEAISSA
jgi:DNA modification methylase